MLFRAGFSRERAGDDLGYVHPHFLAPAERGPRRPFAQPRRQGRICALRQRHIAQLLRQAASAAQGFSWSLQAAAAGLLLGLLLFWWQARRDPLVVPVGFVASPTRPPERQVTDS